MNLNLTRIREIENSCYALGQGLLFAGRGGASIPDRYAALEYARSLKGASLKPSGMIIDLSAIKKCIWITWLRFNKHWFNHNCLASPFSVCMIFDVCDGRRTKFLENFAKGFEGLSRSLVFTSQSSQQDWDCGSQSLSWHSLGEFGRGTAHQTPQGPENKNNYV